MSITVRERTLPSGKVQLFLDVYEGGKRKFESLKIYLTGEKRKDNELRKLAEAIRAKREVEAIRGEYGFDRKEKLGVNVFEFSRKLIAPKHPKTQETYRNMLVHLRRFHGSEQLSFGALSSKFCEDFRAYLLSKLKSNSALAYLLRFRTILKKAIKEGIITSDPLVEVRIKKTTSLPRYLQSDELQRLAATHCGNQVVRDAFIFACLTGFRYQDVASLTWANVKGAQLEIVQSKTGDALSIPLSKEARALLERQGKIFHLGKSVARGEAEVIFRLPRRSTIDKVLKSWGKRAGVSVRLSFHKGRHTFATMLISSGSDIYTASKLLGHKDLATTTIYAKVVDQKKTEAIQRLPSFGVNL